MKAHHIRVFCDYEAGGYAPSGKPASAVRKDTKHLVVFEGVLAITPRDVIITALGVEECHGADRDTRRLYSMRPMYAYYTRNEVQPIKVYVAAYVEDLRPRFSAGFTFQALAYGHYADNEHDTWSSYLLMGDRSWPKYLRMRTRV